MITLTTEQAQQIEEALVATTLNKDYWLEKCMDSLDTIRAARAQEQAEPEQYPTYGFCPICGSRGISRERRINGNDTCANGHSYASNLALHIAPEKQAEQPVSQEYQDHLVNQSFDWAAMAAKHQFMEGYRIGLAEMREKCAKVCDDKHDYMCSRAAAAIRAIKFEGDTGFRPVSEMIAEHKQDPKKAAAIEKAKMRKAEQKPVAWALTSENGEVLDCISHTYKVTQPCTVDYDEPLYTHPVRTKDLTGEEIERILTEQPNGEHMNLHWFYNAARAVIAADREKNK